MLLFLVIFPPCFKSQWVLSLTNCRLKLSTSENWPHRTQMILVGRRPFPYPHLSLGGVLHAVLSVACFMFWQFWPIHNDWQMYANERVITQIRTGFCMSGVQTHILWLLEVSLGKDTASNDQQEVGLLREGLWYGIKHYRHVTAAGEYSSGSLRLIVRRSSGIPEACHGYRGSGGEADYSVPFWKYISIEIMLEYISIQTLHPSWKEFRVCPGHSVCVHRISAFLTSKQ